jgi:acetylornithine deacetylase/succinyl-diaminopimelate desuccinylase-like protein
LPASGQRAIADAVDRAVHRAEPRALTLLRRLIATPSVTGGEGRHDDPGSVSGLLWSSLAHEAGIERRADQVYPERDNVMALVRGVGARVVVLDAHTDTVSSGNHADWVDGNPYSAADAEAIWMGDDRIRLVVGGRTVTERPVRRRLGRMWEARDRDRAAAIYGRGSFDNKGPVVVAWLATVALAEALRTAGMRLAGALVCGFTIDEEAGMAGVRALAGGPGCWLDREGLLPPLPEGSGFRQRIWGVALDGSYGFVPVVGHRGIAQLLLTTRGQAAHAATPELGVSAVTRMAAALHALDANPAALTAALAPLFRDGLLDPPTVALGTSIVGGDVRSVTAETGDRRVVRGGINVVADWCEATIDIRHPRAAPGIDGDIRGRIATTVAELSCKLTRLPEGALKVDVLGGGPPCAILASAADGPDDELVGPILRHGLELSGFEPWVETAPGGTDATVMINEGRIRSIVEFGPAGAFAHEPHEFVERDQIAVGARILARTIVDLIGVEPA